MGGRLCLPGEDEAEPPTKANAEPMKQSLSKQQSLLQKLMDVEGFPDEQTKLFDELKTQGCIMIATLHFLAPEASPAGGAQEKASSSEERSHHLVVLSFVRGLMASCVWSELVQLVKADEEKFFVFSPSVPEMLRAACKIAKLAVVFPTWLKDLAPSMIHYPRIGLKIGMEFGDVLLGTADCYGDPVNVASKLGEDIAKTGEIFMGPQCFEQASQDPSSADLLKHLALKEGAREISKIELKYHCGETAGLIAASSLVPDLPKEASDMEGVAHAANLSAEEVTVFVCDMSGFTKLTKRHGILHYMRLVLKVREIMVPLIEGGKGRVIKYDGDDIIAIFPESTTALAAVDEGWRQISKYNETREEDFKIRMGCALDHGEVLIHGTDIVGLAYERCWNLAEEVSDRGQVLITDECSELVKWDTLPTKVKVRQDKLLAEGGCGKIIHAEVDGMGQVQTQFMRPLES